MQCDERKNICTVQAFVILAVKQSYRNTWRTHERCRLRWNFFPGTASAIQDSRSVKILAAEHSRRHVFCTCVRFLLRLLSALCRL